MIERTSQPRAFPCVRNSVQQIKRTDKKVSRGDRHTESATETTRAAGHQLSAFTDISVIVLHGGIIQRSLGYTRQAKTGVTTRPCHGISIRREIIEYLITLILRLHRYMLEMIFRAYARNDATHRIGLRPVAILGSNRIGSRCRKIKSGTTSRSDSSSGSQSKRRG